MFVVFRPETEHVLAVPQQLTRLRQPDPAQDPKHRGLTAAVLALEDQRLARIQGEVQFAEQRAVVADAFQPPRLEADSFGWRTDRISLPG